MPEHGDGTTRGLVGNAPVAFPPPHPRTGLAVRRQDLPGGLDFVTITLSGHEFPRHVHEGYTFGLVDEGCFEYWCAGEVRICPPGSLILMNPGEVHTGRARPEAGAACYRVIYPTIQLVESLTGTAPPLVLFESADSRLVARFRRLAPLASCRSPDAEPELAAVLEALVSGLSAGSGEIGCRRRHRLARAVQDHLRRNLAARPTLDDLGQRLGLHPGYLRRVFAEVMGLSARSYLLQLRVMRARQLLGKGAPIADVIWTAGFSDQPHLTREFKRTMGFAPREFQQELGYR